MNETSHTFNMKLDEYRRLYDKTYLKSKLMINSQQNDYFPSFENFRILIKILNN